MKRKKLLPLLLVLAMAWLSQILTAQSALSDDSDGPFTIFAQTVTVLAPNGGENWEGGETHNITWSMVSSITNVNIDYSTNNGSSWTSVATNIANNGTHAWIVPVTISTNCLVRISDANNTSTYDVSNGVFTILAAATLSVISPNGGENWNSDSTRNITWTSTGDIANVNIDYSTNSGSNWTPVAANIANSGTYNWTVPATVSTNCLVRVSDAIDSNPSNISNRIFSISSSATETITTPNLPTGPASGSAGVSYMFSSSGANSNFADALQYRFDWGDGSDSGWIAIGTTSAAHAWVTGGTFQVRAMARCATHTSVESPWSETYSINITTNGIPGLLWNTFMGGITMDYMLGMGGIAVDNSGNIYITGWSNDSWGSPLTPFSGNGDVFVAKFNASGILLWNTFLGGNGSESGGDIIVDSSGNIYITGSSDSIWGNPLYPFSSFSDAFVAKLSASGILIWNTFLGGNSHDSGKDIAIDNSGNIYITGYSASTWGSPLNPYSGGENDAFVTKLNSNGTREWHTFLGGSSIDLGWSITVGNSGNIYVSGCSSITWGNPLNAHSGGYDVFVAKLNSSGTRDWNTFMFGSSIYKQNDIAVDNSGNIFVTGQTGSWGSPLNSYGGGTSDAFVVKLNASGIYQWHTFLGGTTVDFGEGITLDISGNIYVTGYSASTWGTPLNPFSGGSDTFIAKLNASGIREWNAFLGGNATDQGQAIVLDNRDNIYVTGQSSATWGTPHDPYSGNYDAFVAKLGFFSNTLTVTSPNGSEEWIVGVKQYITWSQVQSINSINIDYSTNNGSSWTPVVANTANDGLHTWIVPDTLSTNCLMRVSDADNAGTYDVSDAVFTISKAETITVTTPNGSENWVAGSSQNITWSSTGPITNVNIDYSTDNGSSWTPVTTNISNSGAYNWIVPNTLSTNCLVRVSDAAIASTYDESDAVFTILAVPTLTVIAPNGGENWISGTAHNITWSSTGPITNVNIDYSTDNGSSWIPVTTNIANSGAYNWILPNTLSTNCMVRVSDVVNAAIYDVSNSVFSISSAATESITAPNPPSGAASGLTGSSCTFSSDGANSNYGDALQYRFDWGDGSDSGWLAVGTYGAVHTWIAAGTYQVRAMARCVTHTGVESPWSATHSIIITDSSTPILLWNTFLGGTDYDDLGSTVVDGSGNIYITGNSYSTWGSPLNPFSGSSDVFVAKLNANGMLQWHTFLGSNGYASVTKIAVDSSGNIYVTGSSYSTWGSPLNPFSGSNDVFVAKLNASGIRQWHTFFGGSGYEVGNSIAVDNSGNIFVAGQSNSTWGNPLNPFGGGYCDAFVAKLNADGIYQWHIFLGGNANDAGYDITIDGDGNIFLTGYSYATWGSPLNPHNGGRDAFVAKLNANGVLLWHTFLGGSGNDSSGSIVVDNNGNILVTGTSYATWGSPLNYFASNMDAFVANLNTSGVLQWHTFIGGSSSDYGEGIEIDGSGNIYITGSSSSTWGSPLNPFSSDYDAFAVKLNSDGIYQWHTFLGGNGSDDGSGIAIDGNGNVYISGYGDLTWGSPINPYSGYYDVFVAKLGLYTTTLTVTSPNGGEHWNSGETHNITWNIGSSITNINIDYSTDNGSSWALVAANVANTGTYAWTVPATISTTCLVRISDTINGATYDISNGVFTIAAAATLIVASPNGGENWISDSAQSIIWNSTGTIANVNIDYSIDNNGNWISVAANIANSGTYAWTVPATPSSNCLVRVSDADNPNVSDSSDAIFSIFIPSTLTISGTVTLGGTGLANVVMNGLPSNPTTNASGFYTATVNYGWSGTATLTLAGYTFTPVNKTYTNVTANQTTNYTATITPILIVSAPNGGENWIRGNVYAIRWTASNVANVKIELLKANVLNSTITSSTPAASGSYSWIISAAQAIAGDYKIRITSTTSSTITDSSDANFAIAAPFVTIGTPNGGEQWQRGTTQIIKWTSSGVTNVKIELLKGTSVNKTITSSTPATSGTYSWTIPAAQTAGTNYKIRITSTSSSTILDSSNANFTIFIPSITVTAPATGNSWIRGTTKNITWTAQGTVNANVKIQLFKGTTKTLDITTSTPTANCTFIWNIPSTLAAATTYAIKVIALDNLVTGTSGTFSIVTGVITVTAPAAGTKWQRGVAHAITWTKDGTLNANVKIQLYKGTTLDSTIVSTTPNDGSYNWTISANKTLATTYKIRVTTADSLVYGDSGVFSITSTAALILKTPNGNERLSAHTIYPISWTIDPSVNEVKLEYSRNNGGTFFTIADHLPNSGRYEWLVPVNFTHNAIIRVSDSNGKLWQDEVLLEYSLRFSYTSENDSQQPAAVFWFGSSDPQAPSYGFARVALARDAIQFSDFSKNFEPLSGIWHKLRVRFDFHHDTATLYLDEQLLFENVSLFTRPDHYFEPYLALQSGADVPIDFRFDDLQINIVQLDDEGNDQKLFTVLADPFERYNEKVNGIQNCWRMKNPKVKELTVAVEAENNSNKVLRLNSVAGKSILLYLPINIPARIPFDISDQCFTIENQ